MDLTERATQCPAGRHPWELVRGEFFLRLLARERPADARSVVDVGAGDSWFGSELAASGGLPGDVPVVCWDTAYTDDDLADPPAGVVRTRDAPDGRFDVALLMDVLEHVDDPRGFLVHQVGPLLAPGAVIFASVPAHPWLFGSHDVALGHHRRYRRREFIDELELVAPVVASGALFASLVLPRWLQTAIERRGRARRAPANTGIGSWHHGSAVTAVVTAALRADARWCGFAAEHEIPATGLSHWAVARVPDGRRRFPDA